MIVTETMMEQVVGGDANAPPHPSDYRPDWEYLRTGFFIVNTSFPIVEPSTRQRMHPGCA